MRISIIGQANSGKSYHLNKYTGDRWISRQEGHRQYIPKHNEDSSDYIDFFHYLVNNVDGIIFMVDVHNKEHADYVRDAYWLVHEMDVPMVICGNNKTGEDPIVTSDDFHLNAPYFEVNSNITIDEAVKFICDDVEKNQL